jgi:peptidoglycan/xylan/chitin deacetylase (PgdA/CDA1 family)
MRGVITFTFDDGYEAVYANVVPFLNQHGLHAVFALPLQTDALIQSTGEALKPWTEWLTVREQGHEIAAHGISHVDLRQLSAAALEQELKLPQEKLAATTLVYPGGAHNETVVARARNYYTAARTTQYGFESNPPQNPHALVTVDYTQANWSVAKANLRALWAAMTNRWLIETYHLVDKKPSSLHHSVLFDEFKQHITFIRRLPLAIKTINEVISDRHN